MSHSNNETASSEAKMSYIEKFSLEKNEWTVKITGIASRFKNVEDLVDVQVDLYSERQRATDYIAQLYVTLAKLKKLHLSEWNKVFNALTNNQDYRYTEKEKQKIADDKVSEIRIKLDMIQNHIDYFNGTVKTIDSMIFGVKHRIEIEDFKRGNK